MANSLGDASLTLSTNNTKLNKGLKDAGKSIKDWAKRSKTEFNAELLGKLKGWKDNTLGKITGGLKGTLKGGLWGALGSLGLGMVTTGLDGTLERLKELNAIGRTGKALGMDNANFMGLTNIMAKYGVSTEEASKMMAKLGAKSIEASQGNEQLAGIFSQLGVDATKLSGMSLDQQFLTVSDALSKVPNEAQRAQLGMKLFEEAGLKLAPMLSQSRAELEKNIDAQKKSGLALGDNDMNKLMKAQAALPKLSGAIQGFKNKMLVAFAPLIELIGGKLQKVVAVVADLMNWWARGVSAHWGVIIDVFSEVFSAIGSVADMFGAWIGRNVKLGESTLTVEKVVKAVWQGILSLVGLVYDTIKVIVGGMAIIAFAPLKVFSVVVNAISSVLAKLKELPEALRPDWLDKAITGVEELGKATGDVSDSVMDWGLGTFGNFGGSVKDIDNWFKKREDKDKDAKKKTAGLIPGLGKGGDMGEDKEEKAAKDGIKDSVMQGIIKGSKEDANIRANFAFQSRAGTTVASLQDKQLAAANKTNDKLDKIADLLNKDNPAF